MSLQHHRDLKGLRWKMKIQKLLKIAQNGPKWLKMVKHEKVGPNVQFLNPLCTGGLHKIARFLSSLIGVPIRIL